MLLQLFKEPSVGKALRGPRKLTSNFIQENRCVIFMYLPSILGSRETSTSLKRPSKGLKTTFGFLYEARCDVFQLSVFSSPLEGLGRQCAASPAPTMRLVEMPWRWTLNQHTSEHGMGCHRGCRWEHYATPQPGSRSICPHCPFSYTSEETVYLHENLDKCLERQ